MPRFFVEQEPGGPLPKPGDTITVAGGDALHAVRSLRMRPGEPVTLCDGKGTDFRCSVTEAGDILVCKVLEALPSLAEPSVAITLFQAMPKSDKLETVIQKATELGAVRIVPFFSARCVSRPDEKSFGKRLVRLRKIAREAAMQSGRGIIPAVEPAVSFREMLRECAASPSLFCYENGGISLHEFFSGAGELRSLAVIVGSEGGFEPSEAEDAADAGCTVVSLGPRILRTETAPLCAISAALFATGNI